MEDFLPWLQAVLSFLGPIMVVIVTARMERNRKTDAAVKKLEDEKAAKEKEEQKEEYQKLQDGIKELSTKLTALESTIEEMQETDRQTQADLQAIARHDSLNGQYVHKLAQLVMTLAEGMRDQHLDGNITKAIAAYRRFEQDTLSDIMTKSAIDNDN